MLHAHVGFWMLTLILFIISYILLIMESEKGLKITQMILRLLYVFVFASGLYLVISYGIRYNYWFYPIIKGLSGVLVISMMEMILIKGKKGEKTAIFWTLLVVALVLVFYLGYAVIKMG